MPSAEPALAVRAGGSAAPPRGARTPLPARYRARAHVSVSSLCRLLRGVVVVVLGVLALATGCGGAGADDGSTSQLWITRDRGSEVLYEGTVPAGLTVMQALERVADVETRYGGRFVQAIEGVEGSASRGRDWFFFVNGVAADRSAAEYRLRQGEIAWWDYRRWAGSPETRIVVGAFPEPFLHGYDGERPRVVVTYDRPSQRAAAAGVARLLGGRVVDGRVPCCPSTFHLAAREPCFEAETVSAEGPYRFVFAGDAQALVRDPSRFRFRFEGASCD